MAKTSKKKTANNTYRVEWDQHAATCGTYSVSRKQFKTRIKNGWTVKKAIATPAKGYELQYKESKKNTVKQKSKVASKSKNTSMNRSDGLALLLAIDILVHVFW